MGQVFACSLEVAERLFAEPACTSRPLFADSVNNDSVARLIGVACIPTCLDATHTVVGLSQVVRLEFAKQNLRVNTVTSEGVEIPGFDSVPTTLPNEASEAVLMVDRAGHPDDIASGSQYRTSTGEAVVSGVTLW